MPWAQLPGPFSVLCDYTTVYTQKILLGISNTYFYMASNNALFAKVKTSQKYGCISIIWIFSLKHNNDCAIVLELQYHLFQH